MVSALEDGCGAASGSDAKASEELLLPAWDSEELDVVPAGVVSPAEPALSSVTASVSSFAASFDDGPVDAAPPVEGVDVEASVDVVLPLSLVPEDAAGLEVDVEPLFAPVSVPDVSVEEPVPVDGEYVPSPISSGEGLLLDAPVPLVPVVSVEELGDALLGDVEASVEVVPPLPLVPEDAAELGVDVEPLLAPVPVSDVSVEEPVPADGEYVPSSVSSGEGLLLDAPVPLVPVVSVEELGEALLGDVEASVEVVPPLPLVPEDAAELGVDVEPLLAPVPVSDVSVEEPVPADGEYVPSSVSSGEGLLLDVPVPLVPVLLVEELGEVLLCDEPAWLLLVGLVDVPGAAVLLVPEAP